MSEASQKRAEELAERIAERLCQLPLQNNRWQYDSITLSEIIKSEFQKFNLAELLEDRERLRQILEERQRKFNQPSAGLDEGEV